MERRFEVLREGNWIPTKFEDLKQGDRFRSFDGDRAVTDGQSKSEWVAAGDAYIHNDGTRRRWRIDREEHE